MISDFFSRQTNPAFLRCSSFIILLTRNAQSPFATLHSSLMAIKSYYYKRIQKCSTNFFYDFINPFALRDYR